MEDLTRTRPDVSATQPIQTARTRPRQSVPRSIRLLRTITFGLAIMAGIATLVVLQSRDETSLRNASRLYSPSGHLPGEPNDETRVSMAWSAVERAAGYWWGVVATASDIPREPVIRPSGDDRRVFFPFSGRGYFALRTAFRVDGELRWSDALLYGPIVVRDPGSDAATSPAPSVSPGSTAGPGGASSGDRSESGGSGGSGSGSAAPRSTPVDPRYAGEPGGPGTGSGQPGGPGGPGQPAQQPGGGKRPSSDDGTQGQPGPDGPPG